MTADSLVPGLTSMRAEPGMGAGQPRRTVEDAIAAVRSRSAGRTRYEGAEPYDDELMLAEIERLRRKIEERT